MLVNSTDSVRESFNFPPYFSLCVSLLLERHICFDCKALFSY